MSSFTAFAAILLGLPVDLGGGALDSAALSAAAELEAETGAAVRIQAGESGGLHYLFAERLAPRCPGARDGVFDLSSAEEAVRCFFREHPALLADRGEDPTTVPWIITEVSPPEGDGFQFIRLRQMYGDVPVRTGEVSFVGHLGELSSFLGRLEPPSRVPTSTARVVQESEATLVARAEQTIGEPLRLERRTFDPDLQEIVAELRTGADELISFGETSGLELDRRVDRLNLNLVPKSTTVENYNAFDRISVYGSNPQSVTVNVDMQGSNACLDHGSDLKDGEARVCYAGANDECTNLYCQPGSGNPIYTGYPNTVDGRLMNIHFWMHDLAVFANSWDGAYDAYMFWSPTARDDLSVGLSISNTACGGGGAAACTNRNPLRMMLRDVNSWSKELEIMAHEYGHVVHAQYGIWPDASALALALAEGFAEHNTLRYGMYRLRNFATRSWDTAYLFPPTYFDRYWNVVNPPVGVQNTDHRIKPYYQNGQGYPSPWNPSIAQSEWPMLIYRPWDPASPCISQAGADPYQCGSVLGVAYWTLAWNQIRVPFLGFPAGTAILSTSVFTSTPERLANRAYSFAMGGMPTNGSGTPADFFNRVSEKYWAWRGDGTISVAEYDRVAAALTVHCVGWSGWTCSQYHTTIWHPLPAAWVDQQTFSMGVQPGGSTIRHFARAEDIGKVARYGTPSVVGFGTTDGLGFMRLDGSDDILCLGTNFPSAGNYRLSVAFKESVAGAATLSFFIANTIFGTYQDWVLPESNGSWMWAQGYSPWVSVTAGNRFACIKHKNQLVDIDAILIIKQ